MTKSRYFFNFFSNNTRTRSSICILQPFFLPPQETYRAYSSIGSPAGLLASQSLRLMPLLALATMRTVSATGVLGCLTSVLVVALVLKLLTTGVSTTSCLPCYHFSL